MVCKKFKKGLSLFLAITLILVSGITVFSNETAEPPVQEPVEPAPQPVTVSISANYFEKTEDDYEIIFSSLDVLDEYKAYNFTVTVTDAVITAQTFGPSLKSGSYSFSVVGDNSVNFTNGSTDTYVGGKLVFCSINTNVLPTAEKISFTNLTATDKEGNIITFEPTVTLEEGPVIPELSKKESDVYDMIVALPNVSELSFYDEDSKLVDLDILSAQIKDTVDAFNGLKESEKNNVSEVLAYNMKSSEGLTILPPIIDSMESVYDIFLLSATLSSVDDDNIANYQFITDVYTAVKDDFSAEGLPEGSTVLTEYTDAKTLIESKTVLISEKQGVMDYNSKIECAKKQFALSKTFVDDKYFNDYLDCILASAEALSEDITQNCNEEHPEYRYKKYMLDELGEEIDSIELLINTATSLPEFEVPNMRLQANYTITLTRSKNVAVPATVKISVYEKDDPDQLIETKNATFKNNTKDLDVTMYANKSKYPKADEKVIVQIDYTVDGITYDIGSKTATCLKQLAQAPSSGGLPSGITGGSSSKDEDDDNTSSGTIYPPIKDDNKDDKPSKDEDILFSDISKYDWAEEAIEGLYYAGIINGMEEGIFNPAGNVTREQFCKMVVQLFGVLDYNQFDNKFNDVDPNGWYAPYINSAIRSGYVQGQSNDFFGIGESIMRQDMATILYRALGSQDEGVEIDFTDKDSIAAYAYDAISEFCGLGILNGYEDGSFNPRGTATRAEAAKVIWGVYELMN